MALLLHEKKLLKLKLIYKMLPLGRGRIEKYLPVILLILSFWDLRTDLRLMFDHFTFSSLLFAIQHNLLALVIILSGPSLFLRYGLRKKRPL